MSTSLGVPGILESCRGLLRALVEAHGLGSTAVAVQAKILSAEEAIGAPARRDFPILEGQERVMEAQVAGARGQAFTDAPCEYQGVLADVLVLPLGTSRDRAVFVAVMNAVLAHLGMAGGTLHCKDDAPERCGAEIAASLRAGGAERVGLIGFNPALAEALVRAFGSHNIRATDLNPQNIGSVRNGVELWDGRTRTEELVRCSDVVLVTGTTLVNGTFDSILQLSQAFRKRLILFGVTAAATCRLMGLERMCPQALKG